MSRRPNEQELSTCTLAPTIPSKHRRKVETNQERKGFLCKAKRFPSQDSLNETPGPGSYQCASSVELRNPSFSVKGTTGFVAAKAARPFSGHARTPGPNTYNLQSSLTDRHNFNYGVSRVFRLPVGVTVEGPKYPTPAPNQYDVSYRSRESYSSVVGTSAFLSKTERGTYIKNDYSPSPSHYVVNTDATHHCHQGISSPFKSKTQRIPPPLIKCGPGPGAYSPHQTSEPVTRTPMPRRGRYVSIAPPPQVVPKDPPVPGPGYYDVSENKGPSKRPVPSSAFASKIERTWTNLKTDMTPGPGFYDPVILPRQSFFFNESGVWVPV